MKHEFKKKIISVKAKWNAFGKTLSRWVTLKTLWIRCEQDDCRRL